MTNYNFHGIVLAGGKSRRMGEDKALMNWGGKTLLEHTITVLYSAGADKVWISGGYRLPNAIPDLKPNLGPLGGLYSISKIVASGVYVIVPVDMPLVETWQIKELAAALYSDKNYDSAYYHNNILPLVLYINSKTKKCIKDLLDDENSLSLKSLVNKLNVKILNYSVDKKFTFTNCNNKNEWRDLHNEIAHK